MMAEESRLHEEIVRRLDAVRRRLKRISFLRGLALFVAAGSLFWLGAVALDTVFHFGPTGRWVVFGSLAVAFAGTLFWYVLLPLVNWLLRRRYPDDIELAALVGNKLTAVRDRLANALQVFRSASTAREGYSTELAAEALKQVAEELQSQDLNRVVDTTPIRRALRFSLLALAVAGLLWALFPQPLLRASYRVVAPWKMVIDQPQFVLEVQPGNVEIRKGESVTVSVRVAGEQPQRVSLVIRRKGTRFVDDIALIADSSGTYSYRLDKVADDTEYLARADGVRSPRYTITVVEVPTVRRLQLTLSFPKYSKLGTQVLDENVGDVAALKGTRVKLALESNKSVVAAALVFDDGTQIPLQASGREAQGEFILKREGFYRIALKDRKGYTNPDPIAYRLEVLPDHPPVVKISYPGKDTDLTEDMLLPMSIEAQDDFGFSRLLLRYQILRGGTTPDGDLQTIRLKTPVGESALVNYPWDLNTLSIFPEDVVEYFAEVWDNDTVSGPKRDRSPKYRVRFPSIREIYEELTQTQDEALVDLEEVAEESRELKKKLEEISREMLRDPELDWQQRQQLEEALERQKKVRQELEQVQQKLDQILEKMEQNDLVREETLKKYQELQRLFEEVATPELKQAMRELQKALENIDPRRVQEMMKNLQFSQEDFLKSIERTIELLKRLQIEQKMDEAVRRIEQLRRQQEEVNQNAAEAKSKPQRQKYEELARDESKIAEGMKELEDLLKKLLDKMGEVPEMPQEQIQNALDQMTSEQLQQMIEQMRQMLESGKMSQAQQQGQQIQQSMQQLSQRLQLAQQQMSGEQARRVMRALQKSSRELLELSKQQEELLRQTRGLERNSPEFQQLADRQQDLRSGLERVTEQLMRLSQESFALQPQTGKALGKAQSGMRDAQNALEARDAARSGRMQGQAMAGLDEAVAQLLSAMQNMSGGAGGMSMQQFQPQLQQMAGQQQGINQQTMPLGQGGQLTLEQQAAMERLAAEQEALRKSLEELQREMGNREEILGSLDKIAEDMKKVVEDLSRKNVGRETIERQQRILSRMLDASRSVRRRDFSRKRRAEVGRQRAIRRPGELPPEKVNARDQLYEDLLRALREGYSKDYRELIQKYFEALASSKEKEEATP
jgi:hypothetical protein